ncbi:MAG: FAD-binding protein [Ahrensia sp.]|nr:FAD-binding protein [Ahrensia sp.]
MSSVVLKPKTEGEAAQMIADARAEGLRLEILGNGSKRGLGNDVVADRTISSSALSGITAYAAAELVMVAKAGTTMAEIDKVLAKNKQMHVFEPADLSKLLGNVGKQTIGGVAATNMSGPRRFAAGAARDSLLGVRFINGRAEAIKNGGQVMKNVTGLDLVKLMAGSWGTLGFLTEVSFKVLPRPETEITLAINCQSDADAAKIMAAAMATSTDVTGAGHMPADIAKQVLPRRKNSGITLLRLEGLSETIPVRRDRLIAALEKGLKIEELDATTSKSTWTSIRDVLPFADNTQSPVWKISVAPNAGCKVVADIFAQTAGKAYYDWQGGLIWLRLDDETTAEAALVRSALAKHGGGHATLIRASAAVRAGTPCFQPEAPAVAALSARIKTAMDPDGIFNIGKMVFDAKRSAA